MNDSIIKRIEKLEGGFMKIQKRNKSVELDKRWETSWTRRGLLLVFTYLAVALYLLAIDVERAWLNAIVPSVGFLLSTLSLPLFKNIWIKVVTGSKT